MSTSWVRPPAAGSLAHWCCPSFPGQWLSGAGACASGGNAATAGCEVAATYAQSVRCVRGVPLYRQPPVGLLLLQAPLQSSAANTFRYPAAAHSQTAHTAFGAGPQRASMEEGQDQNAAAAQEADDWDEEFNAAFADITEQELEQALGQQAGAPEGADAALAEAQPPDASQEAQE